MTGHMRAAVCCIGLKLMYAIDMGSKGKVRKERVQTTTVLHTC